MPGEDTARRLAEIRSLHRTNTMHGRNGVDIKIGFLLDYIDALIAERDELLAVVVPLMGTPIADDGFDERWNAVCRILDGKETKT